MAVEDFMKPERVVIGTCNEKTRELIDLLYEPFVRSGNPIYFMDEKSAEMTKYAANSFLAAKISFMNEIANLCELTGAEVEKVRIGMGSDSRIGKRFLFPGVGYGGSCFPKDVIALVNTANENNYDFKILKSVVEVNANQIKLFYNKIANHFGSLKGKHFPLWGLAFNPNTDDVREARLAARRQLQCLSGRPDRYLHREPRAELPHARLQNRRGREVDATRHGARRRGDPIGHVRARAPALELLRLDSRHVPVDRCCPRLVERVATRRARRANAIIVRSHRRRPLPDPWHDRDGVASLWPDHDVAE